MPVAPPPGRLIIKRSGHSITRKIPKPVILVDSHEQKPFDFKRFPNWIETVKTKHLDVGDYTVEGMEDLLALERKSLPDLIGTVIQRRNRFISLCEELSRYRWRAIIVEATYKDIKSDYGKLGLETRAHPNAVSGSLDAAEVRFNIPVIYASRNKKLAEEKAASWLSKHFTYWYLEENGFGRVLQSGDL